MGLAPEPGIGARLAAEVDPPPTPDRMTGVSVDDGATFLDFDLDGVMDDEAIALEDAFGVTWLEFLRSLNAGSVKGERMLVWLAQRRTNPDLAPGDVSFKVNGFTIRAEPGPLPEGEPDGNVT